MAPPSSPKINGLNTLMEQKGFDLAHFARKLRVTKATVSRWATKDRGVPPRYYQAMSRLLGLPLSDFVRHFDGYPQCFRQQAPTKRFNYLPLMVLVVKSGVLKVTMSDLKYLRQLSRDPDLRGITPEVIRVILSCRHSTS